MLVPTQFIEPNTFAPRAITRQILINHFLSGFPIAIGRDGVFMDYTISGISLESGAHPPTKPTTFILSTDKGELFVRTAP